MGVLQKAFFRAAENDFVFRHIINARPTREFRACPPTLGNEAGRMLDSLDRTGLAMSHVNRFPGLEPLFESMRESAVRVEQHRTRAAPISSDQMRTYAFTGNLLGSHPIFDADSIFARFSCHPPLLDIVNSYCGMFSQLRKYAVFRNFATGRSVNSSWHRDGVADWMVIRLFAYFNDVDESNGATRYATGTHRKGPSGSRCQLEDADLEGRAVSCRGPAGTIVLADTRGYHRAGAFEQGERWLFNAMYTSPGVGADYFTRRGRRTAACGDPVSWALSSPMRFGEGLLGTQQDAQASKA